jgi:hypothetical protein
VEQSQDSQTESSTYEAPKSEEIDPEQAKAEADAKHEARVKKAEELEQRVTNVKDSIEDALEIGK